MKSPLNSNAHCTETWGFTKNSNGQPIFLGCRKGLARARVRPVERGGGQHGGAPPRRAQAAQPGAHARTHARNATQTHVQGDTPHTDTPETRRDSRQTPGTRAPLGARGPPSEAQPFSGCLPIPYQQRAVLLLPQPPTAQTPGASGPPGASQYSRARLVARRKDGDVGRSCDRCRRPL